MKAIAYKIMVEAHALFLVGAGVYLLAEMILPGLLTSRIGSWWIFLGFALTVLPLPYLGRGILVAAAPEPRDRKAAALLALGVAIALAALTVRGMEPVIWGLCVAATVISMTAVALSLSDRENGRDLPL